MSEDLQSSAATESAEQTSGSTPDSKADAIAMVVIYTAAVAMAVHFMSGWTFDF